jgi:hypothetical protein
METESTEIKANDEHRAVQQANKFDSHRNDAFEFSSPYRLHGWHWTIDKSNNSDWTQF